MKPIYIVSGFPRSGTTAMMQALESGGLTVVRSNKRADTLRWMSRSKYDNYQSNAEYEVTIEERNEPKWPRQHEGKLVKAVAPWLPFVAVGNYRVIFMRRETEEIRQSLEAARYGDLSCDTIDTVISEALASLANRRDVVEVHEVWYDDLLSNPERELKSLDWPINAALAAKTIDPNKKRFDLPKLVIGA